MPGLTCTCFEELLPCHDKVIYLFIYLFSRFCMHWAISFYEQVTANINPDSIISLTPKPLANRSMTNPFNTSSDFIDSTAPAVGTLNWGSPACRNNNLHQGSGAN